MLTRVEISKIRPNPWRDFTLYPIDEEQVAKLVTSINSTGFWVGLQVREHGAFYQLSQGHHRIEACRRAKMTQVNVEIADLDDDQMIRILTAENATQKANNAAASLDAVAATCKRIAYLLLRYERIEDVLTIVKTWSPNQKSWEIQRGKLLKGEGIGEPCISAYGHLPKREVDSAISILKDSGRFSQIVDDVRTRVDAEIEAEEARLEAEAKAAEAAAEKAKADKKAQDAAAKKRADADKAKKSGTKRKADSTAAVSRAQAKRPKIFDESCAHLFKTRWQLDTFKKLVLAEHNRKRFPLDRQKELALAIVRTAKMQDRDVTAEFIRECVANLSAQGGRIIKRAESEDRQADDAVKIKDAFDHIRRGVADINKGTNALSDVARRRARLPAQYEQKLKEHWSTLRQAMQGIAKQMGVDLDVRRNGSGKDIDGEVGSPNQAGSARQSLL